MNLSAKPSGTGSPTTLATAEPCSDLGSEQWGTSAPLTTEEARNLDTMQRVIPAWNRRDVPGILAHYDDEISWLNVATGERYQGKSEVGAFLAELFAAVPDLTLDLTRRMPRGSLVAEEYTIAGTHRGTLFGIPATGRRLEMHAVSFVEMRDGRLKEDHFYFDVSSVLRQMGLFPPVTVAQTTIGKALMRVVVRLRYPARRR